MAAVGERRGLVEQRAGTRDHLRTAYLVVAGASAGTVIVGNGIGPVESVIQAAPAGIRRVQRVPRIGDRHNQLGSRHHGNLQVHVGGFDLERVGFRFEIADIPQKSLVIRRIEACAVRLMIAVDLLLKGISSVKQSAVCRTETRNKLRKAPPKLFRLNAGTGDRLGIDERIKRRGDRQIGD